MPNTINEKAYSEGYDSAWDGLKDKDNPYDEGTFEQYDWLLGFCAGAKDAGLEHANLELSNLPFGKSNVF